jgi:hypothetical protein
MPVYHNRMKKYFAAQQHFSAIPAMVAPWAGFMLVPMTALSCQMQQAISCQRMLYELAYAAAEEDVWFYRDGLSDFSI